MIGRRALQGLENGLGIETSFAMGGDAEEKLMDLKKSFDAAMFGLKTDYKRDKQAKCHYKMIQTDAKRALSLKYGIRAKRQGCAIYL